MSPCQENVDCWPHSAYGSLTRGHSWGACVRKTDADVTRVSSLWDCGSSILGKPLTCTGVTLDRYQMCAILFPRRKQIQSSCLNRNLIQTLIGPEDNTNSQQKGKKILPNGQWYGVYRMWLVCRPWKWKHFNNEENRKPSMKVLIH